MNVYRITVIPVLVLSGLIPAYAQKPDSDRQFVQKYCQGCHNDRVKSGTLSLEQMDPAQAAASPEKWEKVIRKLRAGMMPPAGAPRPERTAIDEFVGHLSNSLDQYAAKHPNPGMVGMHRLNRTEYGNAVRDLLAVNKDGDGSLLDHSVILYGSSMSNGNQHDHDPLPVVIAGGASGRLQGDRHIVVPPHTPMSNLLLSVLDKLGIDQKSFGDSTGKLEI